MNGDWIQLARAIRRDLREMMPKISTWPLILVEGRGVMIVGYLGPMTFYLSNDNRQRHV